jgi:HSP20 family molecular chaperone IbpA
MNRIIRRDPVWSLFAPTEFDKIVETFFNNPTRAEGGFPKAEMKATDEHLIIQFALAGYPKDKLNVEVSGSVVTVKGDKVEDEENLFAGRAFTWSRRDARNIWNFSESEVKYEDGMLTIKTPKREELKPKSLKIS